MDEGISVLVCGTGEIASAIARRLLLAGCGTALHQHKPPQTLRRRASFADAWFTGLAAFQGVEARRCKTGQEFMSGLRGRMFIPLLTQPFDEAVSRFPWDVLIDARHEDDDGARTPRHSLTHLAGLTIGLGHGMIAGDHVDFVVAIGSRDPGAVFGPADTIPAEAHLVAMDRSPGRAMIHAPHSGIFHSATRIGATVEQGETLGWLGATPISAARSGVLHGLLHDEVMIGAGQKLAEILGPENPLPIQAAERAGAIARAVEFLVETELADERPHPIATWQFPQ